MGSIDLDLLVSNSATASNARQNDLSSLIRKDLTVGSIPSEAKRLTLLIETASPKKEDESQIHETRKGSKFVYWGYEVNTSSYDCIAFNNSYSHQVLGYGRERKVILEAPLYDKDCVLGNILAAHYLSSFDFARANSYARAAESHLGKATPYEKAVFEAVNYLISENMDTDVALDLHSKLLEKLI
ncbi:unnamed protein product [Arabidopsis lyrata]|nr:unnamed protein product [Arabidopsis lyrata]